MRVLVAPDSFGGTLSPVEAAEAIAAGWRDARPGDEVVVLPMSDGGEGLVDALAAAVGGREHVVEVAGPLGLAVPGRHLALDGRTALIESALICGLAMVPPDRRDPRRTTTWGVGQLIAEAAKAGARNVVVGLGGSATVDGGAGALSGLGWRVTVEDGSGLKIGGEDLPRVGGIAPGWVPREVDGVTIELLADVTTTLHDAPRIYGPQKGADEATVHHLEAGLRTWSAVVERDLGAIGLDEVEGSGAAGGLGYALAAAHGGVMRPGAAAVADLVGLDAALEGADLVLTGEGRIDGTSFQGKVLGEVASRAKAAGVPIVAVSGGVAPDVDLELFEAVIETGPPEPVAEAAQRARTAVAAWAARDRA